MFTSFLTLRLKTVPWRDSMIGKASTNGRWRRCPGVGWNGSSTWSCSLCYSPPSPSDWPCF